MLRVTSALPLDLLVDLLAELSQLCTGCVLALVLLLRDCLLTHVLNDLLQSLLEVEELHEVRVHIDGSSAALRTSVDSSAAFDGIDAEQVLVRLAQLGALRRQQLREAPRGQNSALPALGVTVPGKHLVLDGLEGSLHQLEQPVPANQLP
jgi:hypothetical protein